MSRRWLSIVVVCLVVSAGCSAAAPPAAESGGTVTAPAAPGADAPGADVAPEPEASSTSPTPPRPTTATADDDAAAAACDGLERPPLQAGSHLIGDQAPPVAYSSTPPTSGWHSSGHLEVSVREVRAPLTEPEQVSVLEAGGIVVSHGHLDRADRRRLARRVRDRHDGAVAVTPYGALSDGEVAFTSWGVLQRCDGVDLDALERFVDRFGPDGPVDPGH